MADDLGYADLGCYGNLRNRTPHLDRLANEGVRFTDFHSSGPGCSPTRAALLTGLYPQRVGIEFALPYGHPGMAAWENGITLAEHFQRAGYATGIYGKWHLGDYPRSNPIHHGFDEFEGHLGSDTDYKSKVARTGEYDWWRNAEKVPNDSYNTNVITERSVEFIRKNAARPFFLIVSHSAIHFPWMTAMDPAYRPVETKHEVGLRKLGPRPTGADVTDVVRHMVESLDESTGRIIEALQDGKLEDRTVVIFTSDNGGYLHYQGHHHGQISNNGIYRGQKATVYEGGHRVPLIVRHPKKIRGGQVINDLVLTMDLTPTLMDVAGIPLARTDFDGISIASLLTENVPMPPERTVYWRMGQSAAARRGDWKLVRQAGGLELFNLSSDPAESVDLQARYPDLAKDLNHLLEAWEDDVSRAGAAIK